MQNRALILGGYGNFGKYISRTLLNHNIPVILAGRNPKLLEEQSKQLSTKYGKTKIQSMLFDVNDSKCGRQKLEEIKKKFNVKIAINTCGPFQSAGYTIVENCIKAGVNYVDLADGRQFVNNMHRYHEQAVKKNITVITGASSVPGLSSAVIEEYKNQFKSIQKLQYGINPGQRTNRGGDATAKGVMGYIGKPIKPFGNLTTPIYGWQDLYYQQYPQLGTRLFGNCQVPDLDIFPSKYGVKQLRFSAGTQNKFLHVCIWLTSWLIRLGLPINLQKYSSFLLKASHTVFDNLGTDQGGMHMNITGINNQNRLMKLKWFIIVRKGHGPNVPIIPAIVLAKKICLENFSLPGVHTCTGLVTLRQYLDGLKDFSFSTYVFKQIIEK